MTLLVSFPYVNTTNLHTSDSKSIKEHKTNEKIGILITPTYSFKSHVFFCYKLYKTELYTTIQLQNVRKLTRIYNLFHMLRTHLKAIKIHQMQYPFENNLCSIIKAELLLI